MAKGKGAPRLRPTGANPTALAQQLQRMQSEMEKAREALAAETLTVTAAGSAITVVITGHQRVESITISPEALASGDRDMLQDMLTAAINRAIEQSQTLAAERMSALTSGLNLPGV